MNNPHIGKKNLRAVLAMAPTRRFTEAMILQGLEATMPDMVQPEEFAAWLEWNHAQGFVEYRTNPDFGNRREWFLTDAGKQKEGL